MEKMYFHDDDHCSMAISWQMEFNVERPTFLELRIFNHRNYSEHSSRGKVISSRSHSKCLMAESKQMEKSEIRA